MYWTYQRMILHGEKKRDLTVQVWHPKTDGTERAKCKNCKNVTDTLSKSRSHGRPTFPRA